MRWAGVCDTCESSKQWQEGLIRSQVLLCLAFQKDYSPVPRVQPRDFRKSGDFWLTTKSAGGARGVRWSKYRDAVCEPRVREEGQLGNWTGFSPLVGWVAGLGLG